MPISTIYEIPRLNMTFTGDSLQEITSSIQYDEPDYYDFEFRNHPRLTGSTYFFRFTDGSTLTLNAHKGDQFKVTIKVDLVEGKMYQMGRDGRKWLALCRFDEEFGELTLFPTTRRKYAPLVRNSDRMQYHFFEELEPDLKKYL